MRFQVIFGLSFECQVSWKNLNKMADSRWRPHEFRRCLSREVYGKNWQVLIIFYRWWKIRWLRKTRWRASNWSLNPEEWQTARGGAAWVRPGGDVVCPVSECSNGSDLEIRRARQGHRANRYHNDVSVWPPQDLRRGARAIRHRWRPIARTLAPTAAAERVRDARLPEPAWQAN